MVSQEWNCRQIRNNEPTKLTLCLSEFIYAEFAEFKNKHIGEVYGPDSLKVMTTSLEHLLKDTVLSEQNLKLSIVRDRELFRPRKC